MFSSFQSIYIKHINKRNATKLYNYYAKYVHLLKSNNRNNKNTILKQIIYKKESTKLGNSEKEKRKKKVNKSLEDL